MHQQRSRQLQERLTSQSIDQVLDAATRFFSRSGSVYTAFLETRGPTHVALRGQGGEELVIGARVVEQGTSVSGSSYLFDQQVAAFLDSLPPIASAPLLPPSAASVPALPSSTAGLGSGA